jgi:cellulose synthase/poly-beta-1,6-N-acetylglucosamine synthase-like glycosyltransferase
LDCIGSCLESLSELAYRQEDYEVIVVDDGSTDGTGDLARQLGVSVIRHAENRGIPRSRNAGLGAARGEIVAYIDSDVIVDPSWLSSVLAPFDDETVVASGGRVLAERTDHLAERYLLAVGYGNPAPLEFGKSKNPVRRFLAYLNSMFHPIALASTPTEVQAVYTANAAYRTHALNRIGGFDEELMSDEDVDISNRLHNDGGRIIFVPVAIVRHRHEDSIPRMLKQEYLRAENTLISCRKESKIPPLFPFPFVYLLLIFLFLAQSVPRALLAAAVGPLILYSWWTCSAVRTGRLEDLAYPYVQLASESATILGLFRGFVRQTQHRKVVRASGTARH